MAFYIGSCAPPPSKFRSLSDTELKRFIAENSIKPMAIRTLGNTAIILYETEEEMGHYALSIDDQERVIKSQARTNNNSDVAPVSVGGVATGIPFTTLIINDNSLLKEAYEALVTYKDGYTGKELIAGKKGHIIPHEGVNDTNIPTESVVILDKSGNILFKVPEIVLAK